jgi:hypothetical protein
MIGGTVGAIATPDPLQESKINPVYIETCSFRIIVGNETQMLSYKRF